MNPCKFEVLKKQTLCIKHSKTARGEGWTSVVLVCRGPFTLEQLLLSLQGSTSAFTALIVSQPYTVIPTDCLNRSPRRMENQQQNQNSTIKYSRIKELTLSLHVAQLKIKLKHKNSGPVPMLAFACIR
ncbi:hypothetical protein Fmac_022348 [Flemingia macrophylla]|uniref:Uncharacterized protein n=1 Tax=Flemingia macrophylla TaxID=520843 RepID=A0ABD1LZN0_9FABA